MFLNPVDIDGVYMRHISLSLMKVLVARYWLDCKVCWANIWNEKRLRHAACRRWLGTGYWIWSKSSWSRLMFMLIELIELVLSLLDLCDKMLEFGPSKNRWRTARRLWHTRDFRINDPFLWVFLRTSAKAFISISESIIFHLQRRKLQPTATAEKTIWHNMGTQKDDIYWHRIYVSPTTKTKIDEKILKIRRLF